MFKLLTILVYRQKRHKETQKTIFVNFHTVELGQKEQP